VVLAARDHLLVRKRSLNDNAWVDAIDLDPILLSRELERASRLHDVWEQTLLDVDEVPSEFPVSRELLGRERLEGVLARPDEDPLKMPLLRWLHRLLESRVNQVWLARTAELAVRTEIGVSEPQKGRFTLRAMLHEALHAESSRAPWLLRLSENASPVSEAASRHWERKAELARRLKLELDAMVLPHPDVVTKASDFLSRSRDLAREHETADLAEYIGMVLGRDAHRGFPSRLNTHALADWFRDSALLHDLEPNISTLPEPLGASSFARALWSFGVAFRKAASSPTQPFVVTHDPYALEAHSVGAMFAALLAQPAFLTRRLELGGEATKDTCRTISRLWLFELRWLALKVCLRPLALGPRSQLVNQFPELAHDVLGFELQSALSLVLPKLADDDAQRFVALATCLGRVDALVDQHNDDWFRNPRAIDQLRSEARLSPAVSIDGETLDAGMNRTLTQLGNTLGA
jgi:hypothetical protein